jgi:2-amino-4-hydroxy-6-hydroxymethyldihydropteridine diphosphokinase
VPNFLNQVVLVESQLTNEELLQEIYELEEFYGRERGTQGYVSREMDIDVLFIGNEVIATEKLQVPHPRMQERRFVLEPMAEIAADFIHPVLQLSTAELLKECKDQGKVSRV